MTIGSQRIAIEFIQDERSRQASSIQTVSDRRVHFFCSASCEIDSNCTTENVETVHVNKPPPESVFLELALEQNR